MSFSPASSIEKKSSWWSINSNNNSNSNNNINNNTTIDTASLSDSLNSSIESDTTSLSSPEVLRKRSSPSSSPGGSVLLHIDHHHHHHHHHNDVENQHHTEHGVDNDDVDDNDNDESFPRESYSSYHYHHAHSYSQNNNSNNNSNSNNNNNSKKNNNHNFIHKLSQSRIFSFLSLSLLFLSFLMLLGHTLIMSSNGATGGGGLPHRTGPRFTRQRWTKFVEQDAPVLLQQALQTSKRNAAATPTTATTSSTYTVRLQSTRADLLVSALQNLRPCSKSIHQIQIDWRGPPETRPSRKTLLEKSRMPMIVTSTEEDQRVITTDGVLVLSDDIQLTCGELERAFSVWNKSPDRMVGFLPKAHNSQTYQLIPSNNNNNHNNNNNNNYYTLVSDRAAFVHRAFVQSFKTEGIDCGDVALSVRVTAISAMPPLVVKAEPKEMKSRASKKATTTTAATAAAATIRPFDTECLQKWIQGHGMDDLPVETMVYVGK